MTQPLQVERPTLTRAQALRALPRRLMGRPDDRHLGEDVWALVSSKRLDQELDRTSLRDRRVRPFADRQLFPADADLGIFERYRDAAVRERVSLLNRPAFVEPRLGWPVVKPLHLVRRGLVDLHTLPAPSAARYLRARARPGRIRHVPAVVHLRDRSEGIYGHVMQDLVGGRLRLASECGLEDVPILLSRALYEQRYFQDLLRLTGLGDREFVVQDGEFVRTETAYLFDTSAYLRESIEHIQRILPIPSADPAAARRVFVARRANRRTGRGVTNMDAVEAVCRRFGFEVRSTDDLSLDEQIELFSGTRVLAGVHGSALFNMAFRKGAMLTVVEIVPPGADLARPRPWWFYEAAVLGHEHELMVCAPTLGGPTGKAAYRRDFAIDPEQVASTFAAVVDRI